MIKKSTIFVLLISTAIACGKKAVHYKTFDAPLSEYTIDYPTQWEILQNYMGMDVMFRAPVKVSLKPFQENLSVMKHTLQDTTHNLDSFFELNVTDIKNSSSTCEIIKTDTLSIGPMVGKYLIYKDNFQGFQLQWKQVYILQGQTAFILTFVAEQEKFAKDENIANTMFKSFRLKNKML